MAHNQDGLDRLTGKLMKQAGTDEPSGNFTDRVMQSVLAVQTLKQESKTQQYYWFLLFVPVVSAAGWYLSTLPGIMMKILEYIESVKLFFLSVFSILTGLVQNLENIAKTSALQIGFLAILFLLVFETLLTRKKYQV